MRLRGRKIKGRLRADSDCSGNASGAATLCPDMHPLTRAAMAAFLLSQALAAEALARPQRPQDAKPRAAARQVAAPRPILVIARPARPGAAQAPTRSARTTHPAPPQARQAAAPPPMPEPAEARRA